MSELADSISGVMRGLDAAIRAFKYGNPAPLMAVVGKCENQTYAGLLTAAVCCNLTQSEIEALTEAFAAKTIADLGQDAGSPAD